MNSITQYLQEGLFSPKLYVMVMVIIKDEMTLWEMKFDGSDKIVVFIPRNRMAKRFRINAIDFDDIQWIGIGEYTLEDGYKMLYIDIKLKQSSNTILFVIVNMYGNLTKGTLKKSFENFSKKVKWEVQITDAKPPKFEKKDKKKDKFDDLMMHIRGMKQRSGPQAIVKRGF